MQQAQQDALQQKLDTVESLVQALEQYAGHLQAADRARLDWKPPPKSPSSTFGSLTLIAGTAADEHHLQEV